MPDASPTAHNYHFASDNTAGACPEVLAALAEANRGPMPSYGHDAVTREATEAIRHLFETDCEIFFVFNGTAANALALSAACSSYHAVLCHADAHVERDECGAPAFFSGGARVLALPGDFGKLSPITVEQNVAVHHDVHASKPRLLSLTQSTEWGTVYTPEEITALVAVARRHGLLVHMDGARFANAAAALAPAGVRPADLTWRAGVDVLSFGGTKNGGVGTEAIVFFNRDLAAEFGYRRKQAGQLASKMRFLAAQWLGLLRDDAWLRHATHANVMAQRLARELTAFPALRVLAPVQVNAVFVELPPAVAQGLFARGWHFYAMIGEHGYRLMCAWDTQPADIAAFVTDLRAVLAAQ
jgi:threonine aldolase